MVNGRTRLGRRASTMVLLAVLAVSLTPQVAAVAAGDGAPMLMGVNFRGDWRAELDDFTAQQGKAPALSMVPLEPQFFDEPQAWFEATVREMSDRNVTPWIEWVSRDTAAMASGAQDTQIRNFWASIDDLLLDGTGRTVIVAPQPEANLDEHSWCCDPVLYQRAFLRIRRLAAEAGLGPEQVRFAFSMNGFSSRGRSYADFYPGDENVDLLGFARLNRGTDHASGWRDYADVFSGPIATMRSQIGTTKPIVVALTGSGKNGGDREAWIREMFDRLPDEPQVIGAIWFNTVSGVDFRIHSKEASIPLSPAFKAGYNTWSPPTARNWVFDGSMDDWVSARGGTPSAWPPVPTRVPTANIFAREMAATSRVGGATPMANAVAISKVRFSADAAAHVVLSRDDKFPDALAGTPLLGDGPLLLTPTTALAPEVRAELDRALASGGRVYLLGGPGALASGIETELAAAGYDVKRLAGDDRFATARQIAEEVAKRYPASADRVLVARGFGTDTNPTAAWADSVTGGGYAAWTRHPVVLTASGELSEDAEAFLAGKGGAVILGGHGAIAPAVEQRIDQVVGEVLRVAGTSRDRTATDLMSRLWQRPFGEFRMILIDGYGGDGWAYGLPAAGLSADFASPLLPVAKDAIPLATSEAIRACTSKKVQTVVVGSSNVISERVLVDAEAHDGGC